MTTKPKAPERAETLLKARALEYAKLHIVSEPMQLLLAELLTDFCEKERSRPESQRAQCPTCGSDDRANRKFIQFRNDARTPYFSRQIFCTDQWHAADPKPDAAERAALQLLDLAQAGNFSPTVWAALISKEMEG